MVSLHSLRISATARGPDSCGTVSDHQISLASTSDPLERHTSSLSAPEAVLTPGSRNATYTTIQRGIGTTDGPTTMRALLSLRKSFHYILRGNVQRTSMSYRYTIPGEHHVPIITATPVLVYAAEQRGFARSASETKASQPETPGPRGKSGAAPSASSSGAFPQFGPTPRQ